MNFTTDRLSGRMHWLLFALSSAFTAAALRRWQLLSAFEEDTGLPMPGAQASVVLTCVLVMAAAWFLILAVHQPLSHRPKAPGQAHRWDLIFLDAGDPVYPILVVLAAFLALGAAPFLLRTGLAQWQEYQKVRELLEENKIDEGRILAEVVVFADKICTDEETVRLKSHIQSTQDTLRQGGSVGRRLDFIAQEMNREANTILSKANDLTVSEIAINLKTEIEKVREQIQNIE